MKILWLKVCEETVLTVLKLILSNASSEKDDVVLKVMLHRAIFNDNF